MRFSVECAFPYLRKRRATSRKTALWIGTSRKTALCTRRLTENRILCRRRHGKAHSATDASRKTAFCNRRLTERRTLGSHSHGKAHFACGSHQKAHSVSEQSRRVRLSVRVRAQNALFRRMCFSLPAQTWSHLTQRRILCRRSHVKAHSATGDSRKSALWIGISRKSAVCTRRLTQKRSLHPSPHGKAHSAPAMPPRRDGKPHFALEGDRRSPRPIHTPRAPYGR